jgi:signal transduction histidine kinase
MQQQFLNRVRDATHRIRDLLNQLLETAVGEGESISLMPPPTEVIRCLEEAVTQISEQQREKAITLRMDFPEDLPAVLAEEEAIVQIFYHLFENAIGVSPQEAEVKVSASVRETEAARYLMIAVSDAGPGIPPDDLGRVFQRAYRTDQAIIQGIADKGTGLMTVKGLCDMLDGRIWVDSEVGTGSTFSVLLPLAGE